MQECQPFIYKIIKFVKQFQNIYLQYLKQNGKKNYLIDLTDEYNEKKIFSLS